MENVLSASNDPQRTKTAACNGLLRKTQSIFTNTVLSDKKSQEDGALGTA